MICTIHKHCAVLLCACNKIHIHHGEECGVSGNKYTSRISTQPQELKLVLKRESCNSVFPAARSSGYGRSERVDTNGMLV